MTLIRSKLSLIAFLSAFALNAAASPVEIIQSSLFLSVPSSPATPTLGTGTSYQDDQLGSYDPVFAPKYNTFGLGGFGIAFTSSLVNDFGTYSWSVTNNTGGVVASSHLMGFLDADLDTNPAFFEYDDYGDTFGVLSGDDLSGYDGWEIDEPGYAFGDIYDHLQDTGVLDNTNNVPDSFPDDVSLALGFDITDWLAGETVIINFLISDVMNVPSGLAQFDVDSNDVIYFSGSIDRVSVVPIPGSGGLMLSGLIFMAVARYRKKHGKVN